MLKPPSACYTSSNSKVLKFEFFFFFSSYAHSRKLEKYREGKKEKYKCNQIFKSLIDQAIYLFDLLRYTVCISN